MMTTFNVTLGDASGYGYTGGESRTFYVDVNMTLGQTELFENYRRNVAEFGFALTDIARGGEDPCLNGEQWKTLVDAGFEPVSYDFEVEVDEEGGVWLDIYLMLDISMFFFLHGLEPKPIWDIAEEDAIPLLGYGGITEGEGEFSGPAPVGEALFRN